MEAWRKELYLAHHGIKGQKWGVRKGPPYPLDAKDHTAAEKKAGWRSSLDSNSPDSVKKKKSRPPEADIKNTPVSPKPRNDTRSDFDREKAKKIAATIAIGAFTTAVLFNVASNIDYAKYKNLLPDAEKTAIKAAGNFKSINSSYLISKPISELSDSDPIVETGRKYTERFFAPNSIYNKKHVDEILKPGAVLSTLSYDMKRTEGADMFYATHKVFDKHQYNALFNNPIPKELYDERGHSLGTGTFLKYRINNRIISEIKVASEDSGARIFRKLYESDSDFHDFVRDSTRMKSHFVEEKYKFKGYREAREALERLESGRSATSDDLHTIYRMFNYVIPSDGGGDVARGADVARQRAKFFKALKEAGYGAVLDTNDAIYGGFKAASPVIVFDQSKVILSGVKMTKMSEKRISELALIGRKVFGI